MNKKRLILRILLISLAAIVGLLLICGAVMLIEYRMLDDTSVSPEEAGKPLAEGEYRLPRIDVWTADGAEILTKTDYVDCTVTLSDVNAENCFVDLPAGIRGRGNDTWKYYPKKPYRIKFEEKVSLFGEEKNKSWVLLAMYNDHSRIKDRMAFAMAESLDRDAFAPAHHYVELYLNGEYNGLYLLTDQVDENAGRTDVKDKFKAEDVEVPFLVELDSRAPEEGVEGVDWFAAGGYSYAIKYPEADERHNNEQFEFIKNYVTAVDMLCRREGVTLAELGAYVDVASLIDFYIVQEAMGQPEINWKSVYMSRSSDGLLVMGPVWDFDWGAEGPSFGDSAHQYRDNVEGLRSDNNWFDCLLANSPEFRAALAARWAEAKPLLQTAIDSVEAEREMLSRAARRDELRWHWYRFGTDFEDRFDETVAWCRGRLDWLDTAFCAG